MSSPLCTPEPESDDELFDLETSSGHGMDRRTFLRSVGILSAAAGASPAMLAQAARPDVTRSINLQINGDTHTVTLDPRTTLLDALRENLDMTGSKKGCDHGQCGACTVLFNGRRINSCLMLAYVAEGAQITTIEGLAHGDDLHAVQQAFMDHDGFQCGYCTPGQICSAVAAIEEAREGKLSIVSFRTGHTKNPHLSDDEIRERMSGNICRCAAYPNIVAAVRTASQGGVL